MKLRERFSIIKKILEIDKKLGNNDRRGLEYMTDRQAKELLEKLERLNRKE